MVPTRLSLDGAILSPSRGPRGCPAAVGAGNHSAAVFTSLNIETVDATGVLSTITASSCCADYSAARSGSEAARSRWRNLRIIRGSECGRAILPKSASGLWSRRARKGLGKGDCRRFARKPSGGRSSRRLVTECCPPPPCGVARIPHRRCTTPGRCQRAICRTGSPQRVGAAVLWKVAAGGDSLPSLRMANSRPARRDVLRRSPFGGRSSHRPRHRPRRIRSHVGGLCPWWSRHTVRPDRRRPLPRSSTPRRHHCVVGDVCDVAFHRPDHRSPQHRPSARQGSIPS